MKFKKFYLILLFFLFSLPIIADETKIEDNNTEFNIYTGMFDFSDDKKRSTLVGVQHKNENLNCLIFKIM